jgi:prepilin-type N-terminal cleavage/methylation domain-containing protein
MDTTHMDRSLRGIIKKGAGRSAFTLAEVVIALAILAILIQGVVFGYINSARRAEWSAHSLAAQSLASQGIEQARAAKWDPQAWPTVDELPPTNFVQIDMLDIPISGEPVLATNFISVSMASSNPVLREIRADCVWSFLGRGLFTNTVITLRAPDQ